MITAPNLPPIIASRYVPVRLIAKGGMGAVYEVEHARTGERLALKVLSSGANASPDALARFKHEARASARIKSENVVRVTDADVASELGGVPFLVMELLEGTDLEEAAKASSPAPATVVEWLRQVARAIDKAHALGIVHRDLKPENLFLAKIQTGGGFLQVKILDFGIVKMMEEGTGATGTGQILGTPKYMAPEQASANTPVTPAIDRCALGLIAYRLLVGESYYQGGVMVILGQLLHGQLQPPSSRGSLLGEAFDAWFLKACHRNPDERFMSASEQIESLAVALGLSAAPIEAAPETSSRFDLRPGTKTRAPYQSGVIATPAMASQPTSAPSAPPSGDARVIAIAPLRTLDVPRNNLPTLPTALIGRDEPLKSAVAMLRQPGVRLVTLTGPGGVGKTRLGLQIAADLVDETEDGVWFVALAPIRDAGLVASTIAATLGLAPSREVTMASVLEHHLRDRKTLLVLDNFEQVIDAAPLVAALLAATRRLKILVSSRTLLQVSGEHNFAVPPLPPLEAVRLFVERARALKANFRVTEETLPEIAAVCQHLDGLPLAIELAAARVRLLAPKALRARLVAASLDLLNGGARDLPARHRTLRATIAWSFDLLDDREKALFRRLGVFARGAPLAAIEAIVGDVGTLDAIGSLVDKSVLVQEDSADEPRVSMLETLREFALTELDATGEADDLRAKHATWYLSLAEEASRDVAGQRYWLGRLEAEHDNMRGAITWALGRRDAEFALCLTAALTVMWRLRGHAVEGRRAIDAALALSGGTPVARARALVGAALLTREFGDLREARAYAENALAIERTLDDRRGLADALDGLIWVAMYQGDFARGRIAVDEYLALAKELGSKRDLAMAMAHSASLASEDGREDPEPKITEALALFRAIGDEVSVAYALNQLGELVRARGDYRGALALYENSLALARALGVRRWINIISVNVGITLACLGDNERARPVLTESLVMTRGMRAMRPIPPTLAAVARIALFDGDARAAARLLGAADAMLEAGGATALYADRAEQHTATALVVERLGAAAANAERHSGRALSTDAAVDAALTVLKVGMNKVAARPEALLATAPPQAR